MLTTRYDISEIGAAAEPLVANIVGEDGLGALVQMMLDHETPPMLLTRAEPPVAEFVEPLRGLIAGQLARLGKDERSALARWFPPTGYGRDLAGALLQAATHRRYFELPISLYDAAPRPDSRVFTALPALIERVDGSGLLRTNGLRVTSQAVYVGGYALSFHQLLRRGFGSNVNDSLVGTLLGGVQTGEISALRIAIDERRLRGERDQRLWFEKDYWVGPPLTGLYLDRLHGSFPTVTVHGRPVGADVAPWDPYDRFAGRWSLGPEPGEKTFEGEELVDPATLRAGDLVLIRYVHAIRVPPLGAFRHVDGAVRVYTAEAYTRRRHLQFAPPAHGLSAYYRKVFRADGSIGTGLWSDIVARWFRGNELTLEYLGTLGPQEPDTAH